MASGLPFAKALALSMTGSKISRTTFNGGHVFYDQGNVHRTPALCYVTAEGNSQVGWREFATDVTQADWSAT